MISLAFALLASVDAPNRVTVFPDRAEVVRTTTISCGNHVSVVFPRVPPSAAANSFRAHLELGTIDGLRAEMTEHSTEYSKEAEALAARIEELERQLQSVIDESTAIRAQLDVGRRFIDVAGQWVSKELAAEKPNLKNWHTAYDTSLRTARVAASSLAAASARQRALANELQELRLKLSGYLTAQQKRSWTVEVLASCPAGKSAQLELSYLVGGSSWSPVYEARADEPHGTVDFSTWATVRQATGEDWSSVSLTLSTALPTDNATPPEPRVLTVTATEQAPEKKVLVRRDEAIVHAAAGKPQANRGGDGVMQVQDQGLSVQMQAPHKTTVPGGSAPVRVFVGQTTMKAKFEFKTIPKLMPLAFRVAQLSNQAPWPLLPGRVDAFRSTGLVGRYELTRIPQGGAMTLTFGSEDSLRVKRTVVEELKRDTGLLGDTKRFRYGYEFELANYGKAQVELMLSDVIPVAELKDIAVSIDKSTTAGYQLAAADGVVSWPVALKPGEKRKVRFQFQVDVPQSYDTGAL